MFNPRDFVLGSAAAVMPSLVMPAFAQTTIAAGTRRGFLERPACRVYYEVTGSGPAIIFAHGIGSNHMTWWQQVAHFSDRYACVTFSHRGYPPGREIGVPDPNAKVEQVREAGHSVYFLRASIFNHLVDRFFAAVG